MEPINSRYLDNSEIPECKVKRRRSENEATCLPYVPLYPGLPILTNFRTSTRGFSCQQKESITPSTHATFFFQHTIQQDTFKGGNFHDFKVL